MDAIQELIELGWDDEHSTGKLLHKAQAQYDAMKKALKDIRDNEGKVCETYEICEHVACQSSYNAWAIVDKVLSEWDIEE